MKRIFNRYLLLIAVITLLPANSCIKNSGPVPINSELLQYFNYQDGTYWIYRDSINGNIDSFAVIQNYGVQTVTAPAGNNMNEINISINEYHNDTMNDTIGWFINIFQNCYEFGYGVPVWTSSNLITFPITPTYKSIIIDSLTYNDVYEQTTRSIYNSFYINLTDGCVKFSISHPNDTGKAVWELKKCFIKI